jgi:RNA polymerase sigma-70 factor (ECF subfamily)
MSKTDDLRWIAQVTLLGDTRGFDKLTQKYQSSIRRFFLNLTMGDAPLSDDLAQETFIKAYLKLSSFKAVSGFSTWLFRIAYNVFYDTMRSKKPMADIDENEINRIHSVNNEFSSENIDIYNAIKLLRHEEQTAVLLFYIEDKSHSDIAKIMNCPLGTVKTYILKGKEKLGTYLTNVGYGK